MARRLHICGLCRGPSHAFVALRARGVVGGVTVRARVAGGRPVPVASFELLTPDALSLVRAARRGVRAWVVALPLLSATTVELVSASGEACASVTVPAIASPVASRLLTLTRPTLAALMRSTLTRMASGTTVAHLLWASPASVGEGAPNVWRFAVSYATADGASAPALRVFDGRAEEVPSSPMVLEDHLVPAGAASSLMERLVTFSVTLPAGREAFFVVATLEGSCDPAATTGFAAVFARRARRLLDEATRAQAGVVGDGAYGPWLAARRATAGELAAQARAGTTSGPLMSIVMPVFRPEREHLDAAVASVVAQSWPNWELVVVDASEGTDDGVASEVLAAYADEARVRVVGCRNASIAENTNLGIAEATGDYVAFMDHDDVLEPDALWHFARALSERPGADLIYCDEDRLGEDGRLRSPALKVGPSLGKLYGYNYVTHLLMVSRRALDLTERSPADVSGAQDLDLTLRAFEVARDVVHVPRVLYHWRDHPGSTAGGGDAKPYAHEAGRRAIERHLARRRIAGEVGDGPLPYTYRVRFELPTPSPRVSVIIPSRDHATLLGACVSSLVGLTDYPDYEVVIVENGSVEDATFELYDRLSADGRVRVVRWEPPVHGAFSYSAACNFGAASADGDALLFLNNDTEVVDGTWLRELVGCLARPEVAVVGARLVFPDGLLQHAGMVATPQGEFMHASGGIAADSLGYGYGIALPSDVEMVTGACQLVRRRVFDALGGYDEGLAVGFNDGDLCLRARAAGHVVAYCPYATLIHREFASRGRESADVRLQARYLAERARFVAAHADALASGAVCRNPGLDPDSPLPRLAAW